VPLGWLVSFCVLTCLSLCGLQFVSAPCLLGFFLCPDLSLPLWSPESESPCLVGFILYPDMSLPLLSPEGECPLLGWFLSVSWLYFSVYLLQGVSTPLFCLSIFGILICSFFPTFPRRWAFPLYLHAPCFLTGTSLPLCTADINLQTTIL